MTATGTSRGTSNRKGSAKAVTTTTGTTRTHHPECRISASNLCTCRDLYAAEIRLDRIRRGWTKPKRHLTQVDVIAGLIGIGYIIGRYFQ